MACFGYTDVYVEGGTNDTEHLNDFWRLDLRTMTWQKLPGTTDKPIYFHSGAVTEVRRYLVRQSAINVAFHEFDSCLILSIVF